MSEFKYTAKDLRRWADKIIADQEKEEIEKANIFLDSLLMPFLCKKAIEGYYSYSFNIVRSKDDYFSFTFTEFDGIKPISLRYLEKVLIDLGFLVKSSYTDIFNKPDEARIFISWREDDNNE